MKHYLPWAESFQSHVISEDHVRALSGPGVCNDIDPLRLSFELWGALELVPTLQGEKSTAWSQVMASTPGADLLSPLDLAAKHSSIGCTRLCTARLHRGGLETCSLTSLSDLDKWAGTLIEFYTFDESFVHHVLYVITCAKDRRPMCLGKTDVFKSFAMKLYERYGSMMACCMIASYQHYN